MSEDFPLYSNGTKPGTLQIVLAPLIIFSVVKRITLGDVARTASVSTATVSMALNGKPGSRIPSATVKKVRTAARELGYRPNAAARALKTGRTGMLGFVSDEVTITRFASPMISGMREFAEQAGLSVMMTETAHKDVELETPNSEHTLAPETARRTYPHAFISLLFGQSFHSFQSYSSSSPGNAAPASAGVAAVAEGGASASAA